MGKAYSLRSGGSGPVFDGDAGDVLTLQSNGEAKFSPGGSAIVPLSLEFWVDQQRAGSTQDGSIANPFLTIQNGLDAIEAGGAGTGSLLVADGDYSAEALTTPLTVAIIATGLPIHVASLGADLERVGGVRLVNVIVDGPTFIIGGARETSVDGGGLFGDVDMTGEPWLVGVNATFGDITCIDVLGFLTFRGCSITSIGGAEGGFHADTVELWDSTVNAVEGEHVFAHMSTIEGELVAHTALLEQTTCKAGGTIANTLTADTFSLKQLRNFVGINPQPLLVNVTDHTASQGVAVVPAIEQGSFADVTVGGAGLFCKEGDTVQVALGSDITFPRLANVGIAATWVEPNGDVTIRFFGTTAGGTQIIYLTNIPATP